MQYCSLQYQTWLPSPVTSTAGGCFCFGFVSSFFLELFLHSSSSILCTYRPVEFYLFAFSYCSWSCQGKSTGGLPFPSPVDHVLSELSTMNHPSWVALPNTKFYKYHSCSFKYRLKKIKFWSNSMVVWWLRVCTSTAGGHWLDTSSG